MSESTQTKRVKLWYILKRFNPQIGTLYYAEGQMSKTAARSRETGSIYGLNRMIPFETEEAYLAEIKRLKSSGEMVL